MAQNIQQNEGSSNIIAFKNTATLKAVIAAKMQQNVGFSISWSETCGNV